MKSMINGIVMTKSGLKYFEEVKIGDFILTDKGTFEKVVEVTSKKSNQPWSPKIGERVWWLYGDRINSIVANKFCQKQVLTHGDVFRTRELAREAKRAINKILLNCKHG